MLCQDQGKAVSNTGDGKRRNHFPGVCILGVCSIAVFIYLSNFLLSALYNGYLALCCKLRISWSLHLILTAVNQISIVISILEVDKLVTERLILWFWMWVEPGRAWVQILIFLLVVALTSRHSTSGKNYPAWRPCSL